MSTNSEAAIFCYLIAPFKGLSFEGKVPKITVTPDVEHIIKVQKRLYKNKQKSEQNERLVAMYLQEQEDAFGNAWINDDIPF
ncbi:hypothetical protein HWB19_gp012 [Cronobacter phage vB_CsaP_009]|uniref:Uncharacterized protein n=1 Tax=Cronobacter phage vB_CsaP_009 TaxID=2699738 RepID=A0A679FBR8_9CAUD|nr:hypothetical protein HWB19_gp012 [Cronobacter phage vB_CsaP_009]BBU72658.1 hypothetical protein [Cronobacter phage vB_CsaP_009]